MIFYGQAYVNNQTILPILEKIVRTVNRQETILDLLKEKNILKKYQIQGSFQVNLKKVEKQICQNHTF